MVPNSYDDNGAHAVLADSRQGFHLLLVNKAMLVPHKPFEPLWVFECGDQRSLDAASHWLAVRRAQWTAWGELAETQGQQAIADCMAKLMGETPIGQVQGTIVRGDPDPRALSLGEVLTSPNGLRNEILYQHRFTTTGKRKRFFEWFHTNAANGGPESLISLGISQGTSALANALEEIAASSQMPSSGLFAA